MPWSDVLSNTLSVGLVAGWLALRGYELYDYMSRRQEAQQIDEVPQMRAPQGSRTVSHVQWRSGGGGPVVYTFHGNPAAAELFGFDPFGGGGAGGFGDAGFIGAPGELIGHPRMGQVDLLNYHLGLLDRDFTDADYEMLLALDDDSRRGSAAPLHEADLDALPRHSFHKRRPETAAAAAAAAADRRASGATSVDEDKVSTSGSAGAAAAAQEEERGCSICLESFREGVQVMSLPCLHQFHAGCVEPWLQQNGRSATCPICKTPVFRCG